MAALLHGTQHREDSELWLCLREMIWGPIEETKK
jgi:hypothetical protein